MKLDALTLLRTLLISALAAIVSVAATAATTSSRYEEGTHYVELATSVRTQDPSKIEATEYFSYGCQHCFRFDPLVEVWKQDLPEDVLFNRTPAIWGQQYKIFAQTYYTADALGVLEQAHPAVFNAIHLENRALKGPEDMAKLFNQFGIDATKFSKVYGSFGVRASLQQAEARGRVYRASGVPTFIVNGKYRVEGKMVGTNVEMLKVVNFLIEKERQLKAKSPAS